MKIKNKFLNSLVSSALSILPIIIIVFIMSLSGLTPISNLESITLAIGGVAMIFGLSLFQIGSSNSLTKVGEYMGASLSKQTKLIIVVIFALLLGALITCAEPSILIVSDQIKINKYLLIGFIAGGVGIFVVLGVVRIFMGKSIKLWYLLFYLIVFMLICILQIDPENRAFLPFIFDAGGITTGSATVPFILALGAGAASVRQIKKNNEDSFGLVGLASIGPIISMIILILINRSGFQPYQLNTWQPDDSVWFRFKWSLIYFSPTSMGSLIDVLLALSPIILIFMIYEIIYIKLPKKEIGKLFIGFLFVYLGLAMFLAAVTASMGPVGNKVGQELSNRPAVVLFVIAFLIGMVTILCEPAVHSLTNQISAVSAGAIKKIVVLATLSLGVGVAVLLSAIRSYYGFSILYYLIPGYAIALILMFFTPTLFTSMAFDSGGTASGPMAVSFVMPMMIGITSFKYRIGHEAYEALAEEIKQNYNPIGTNGVHYLTRGIQFYEESFGAVALIALIPIIAIQLLGIFGNVYKNKKYRVIRTLVHDESNGKIIYL